jgi:hypothetical protein
MSIIVNDELGREWKKFVAAYFNVSTCLERLGKTTEHKS